MSCGVLVCVNEVNDKDVALSYAIEGDVFLVFVAAEMGANFIAWFAAFRGFGE